MLFLGFSENNCKFAIGRGIITEQRKTMKTGKTRETKWLKRVCKE